MTPLTADRAFRLSIWLAVTAVLASVALMSARAWYAISFDVPLQLFTGGADELRIYGVWKQMNGMPVYTDPHRIPFTASYYNWLFFETYGWISTAVSKLLNLSDWWLPTIQRVATLAISIAGVILFYASMVSLLPNMNRPMRVLAFALAAYYFLGPLAGFWALTTSADVIANFFLVASLFAFTRYYDRSPYIAVVAFAVLAYIDWSMKQIFVTAPGAVGLYLLWHRDWRRLATLVILLPGLWVATLLIGTDEYVTAILFSDTSVVLDWSIWWRNFTNACIKALPIVIGIGALGILAIGNPETRARWFRQPFFGVFACGAALSALIFLPASAKIGAAENYHFSLVYYLTVLLLLGIRALGSEARGARDTHLAIGGGWAISILAVVAVLAGAAGVVSPRKWHDRTMELKACMDNTPAPVFTFYSYNLLPWMHEAEHHFILAYEYAADRADGKQYERGGIGGLVSESYFGSLLLAPLPGNNLDGADISRNYRHVQDCAGMQVWIRSGDTTRNGRDSSAKGWTSADQRPLSPRRPGRSRPTELAERRTASIDEARSRSSK